MALLYFNINPPDLKHKTKTKARLDQLVKHLPTTQQPKINQLTPNYTFPQLNQIMELLQTLVVILMKKIKKEYLYPGSQIKTSKKIRIKIKKNEILIYLSLTPIE